MDPKELDAMRVQYSKLTDYDLAELHSQGPAGLRAPEFWNLLEEEIKLRWKTIGEYTDSAKGRIATAAAIEVLTANYAPIWRRLSAMLIDAFLLVLWLLGLVLVSQSAGWGEAGRALAVPIAYFSYFIGWEAAAGATPGKLLLGLRLVTVSGGPVTLPQVIGRALARPFVLFGFLWYAMWRTPWGHDVVSRTRVITARAA